MARRAIGIVRVSQVGGRDGDSFASPELQRQRIETECERAGLQLVEVFEELNVSGGADIDGRPGLGPAVARIEAGEAEVVVAAYFDRFFRGLEVQGQVVERVTAAGGEVLAVDVGRISNATAAMWLNATMMGMMAEHYRRVSKERSAESQQRAINRGVPPWPHIVPGYERADDGRLRPSSDAAIMREAFAMRAAGAKVADVREFLRANGIDRNSRHVSWLLGSRVYLGELHFGKYEPNLNAHEAIIDRDVFDQVQRVRVPQGRKAKSERLLARLGVLVCGTCDGRVSVGSQRRGERRYQFYRCCAETCPRRVSISAEVAERCVVEKVRAALADVEGRASAESDAVEAEAELAAAERNLRNAIRNLAVLEDEAEVQAQLLELREVRDRARAHVDRALSRRDALTVGIADKWELLTVDEQRGFIRATVKRAAVSPEGKGAARISVELFSE